jgi:hypothetical protein
VEWSIEPPGFNLRQFIHQAQRCTWTISSWPAAGSSANVAEAAVGGQQQGGEKTEVGAEFIICSWTGADASTAWI